MRDADAPTTPKSPLLCDECGSAYRGERGWRAYLTHEREVAVFCSTCAAREFSEVVGADAPDAVAAPDQREP
jgi:hypothetical protein